MRAWRMRQAGEGPVSKPRVDELPKRSANVRGATQFREDQSGVIAVLGAGFQRLPSDNNHMTSFEGGRAVRALL
jgi:hypothetical protein